MTAEDIKRKILITEKNTLITDKHRDQLLTMYKSKLAQLEPTKPEKKAPKAKKEEVKTSVVKKEKEEPKSVEKTKIDYDCKELVKEAKEKHKKKVEAAKERAAMPKKSEVAKSKEKIERAHEAIEKQIESGKLAKNQLMKLKEETKELLNFIEKAIKGIK